MKKDKRISIKDIASAIGVSITTVSFVLNGKAKEKRISDELIKRITDYIEEVDFKPSLFASGLRTGKSYTIGLLIENIAVPFFAKIAHILEEKASEAGYKIIFGSTNNLEKEAVSLLKVLEERSVDAYIMAAPEGIENQIKKITEVGKPLILFDRKIENIPEMDYVGVNNYESVFDGVNYLAKRGLKEIAFITIDSKQSQMAERLNGFVDAMNTLNIKQYIKILTYGESDDNMVMQIKDFFEANPSIEAVIFSTNYLGINGLKVLKGLKIEIPTQLNVVMYDDSEVFELYTPSISVIRQPIEEIANNIITLLLNKLKNRKSKPKNIILKNQLIIRGSVG